MEIRADHDMTLKSLTPNVAALLCYVAGWISGIVFLVLEQKNRFVRFHALQSIIVFGTLAIAGAILGRTPIAGPAFAALIGLTGFILWIILMVNAVSGKAIKMPWAGDLAEKLTSESMSSAAQGPGGGMTPPVISPAAAPAEPVAPAAAPANSERSARAEAFRAKYYSFGARSARIAASAFAIVWSIALIIFFNFYHHYIAFYQQVQTAGASRWEMYPLLTPDIYVWLPLLTATLALTIIGHAVLIFLDKYWLRQTIQAVLDIFSLVTVASLLSIYPFDFGVIPSADGAYWAQIGTTVTLILIAVGLGIGALTRVVQLIVNAVEGKY